VILNSPRERRRGKGKATAGIQVTFHAKDTLIINLDFPSKLSVRVALIENGVRNFPIWSPGKSSWRARA